MEETKFIRLIKLEPFVLGTDPGYYRGLGYGPSPPSKSRFAKDNDTIVCMQQELKEHRGQLKEAYNLITELWEENKVIRAKEAEFKKKKADFFSHRKFSCRGSETEPTVNPFRIA
ncbi:hypothetical protein Scep_016921 [Stephania cephalantha]|uniref:Uncharacterized protein n=1 Tax=Stephania cephalantha TaxID=152367 RepID=A0AAP0INL0_9MAGN